MGHKTQVHSLSPMSKGVKGGGTGGGVACRVQNGETLVRAMYLGGEGP